MTIQLFTIGFTQKTAEQFFTLLESNGVDVVVDTRLRPNSQLSGFAKQQDLPYFLKHMLNCDYRHLPSMAPSAEILDRYRQDKDWATYEEHFKALLDERKLINTLDQTWWGVHRVCLLCSEHKPDYCHRRLVAEYLAAQWQHVEVRHLM